MRIGSTLIAEVGTKSTELQINLWPWHKISYKNNTNQFGKGFQFFCGPIVYDCWTSNA